MDKNKALDKIKKCLALSKSANANEAATALRQAQALMAKFNLTEADVELQGYGFSQVDVPIQANKKKIPVVLSTLINIIEKAFGVQPIISYRIGVSDTSYRIKYMGPKHRLEMAAYAHTVVYRAMEAAWRDHLKAHPYLRGERSARTSFQIGWLYEVENKVDAIGFTEEEKAAMKALEVATYGKSLAKSTTNDQRLDGILLGAGVRAAADFSLARPMGQERARLEKL